MQCWCGRLVTIHPGVGTIGVLPVLTLSLDKAIRFVHRHGFSLVDRTG